MSEQKQGRLSRLWQVARPMLSVGFSVGLMVYILSGVQWPELAETFRLMTLPALLTAFALMVLNDLFLACKCYFLRPDLSFWRVCCAFLSLRFFSLLPGGNVTGETARLMALRDMTDTQTAAAMLIMDKQTHMIPAQTYCLTTLPFATVAVPVPLVWFAVWSLIWPLLAPGVLFVPRIRRWAQRVGQRLRRWKLGGVLADQLDLLCGFCETMTHHPRQFALHLLCGFLGEGCYIAMEILLSRQLGFPIPWWDWLWLNSMLLLAMVIPFSVMGTGVREAALVVLLGWYGISQSQAMGLPLIISSLMLLKGLAAGVVVMLDRRARARREARPAHAR